MNIAFHKQCHLQTLFRKNGGNFISNTTFYLTFVAVFLKNCCKGLLQKLFDNEFYMPSRFDCWMFNDWSIVWALLKFGYVAKCVIHNKLQSFCYYYYYLYYLYYLSGMSLRLVKVHIASQNFPLISQYWLVPGEDFVI